LEKGAEASGGPRDDRADAYSLAVCSRARMSALMVRFEILDMDAAALPALANGDYRAHMLDAASHCEHNACSSIL
jgi:hypothetical protein